MATIVRGYPNLAHEAMAHEATLLRLREMGTTMAPTAQP
jgi:hypothetical protein